VPVFLIGEVIGDCPAISTPPHQKTTRELYLYFPLKDMHLNATEKLMVVLFSIKVKVK